jgi:hypothetical protein
MVLMDSRRPKDSNDTKFAIFGSTDQKIWIIKVLDEIRFKFLF